MPPAWPTQVHAAVQLKRAVAKAARQAQPYVGPQDPA